MSMNQFFVVKSIMESNGKGATVTDIAKYHVKNVPQVVYSLRQRGHTIITKSNKYFMPFGSREQEARLSKTEKKRILKQFQMSV